MRKVILQKKSTDFYPELRSIESPVDLIYQLSTEEDKDRRELLFLLFLRPREQALSQQLTHQEEWVMLMCDCQRSLNLVSRK